MNYLKTFQIDANRSGATFDASYHRQWFAQNWHLSIYASIVYLICIANGQRWMKNRKAYGMRNAIFIWNISLSFFSVCGTSKLLPELVYTIKNKGLFYSICNHSFKSDPTVEYWMWLFTWSKLIEFGDTAFIVLRKQKLIFLHWSHHVITLIYCFFVFSDLPAIGRYGITMNYMIHSIMYFYYALKVIKISVPEVVSKIITTLQTLQMAIGIIAGSSALYFLVKGVECDGTVSICIATTAMAVYYFILFVHFFVNRYTNPIKRNKSLDEQKTK